MTSDRRNTYVVVALVVCMTLGARMLMMLESWSGVEPPRWEGDAQLTAETGVDTLDVEIALVSTEADVEALRLGERAERVSLCVIDPAGVVDRWVPRGPEVLVLLRGSNGEALATSQKQTLLAVLGTLSQSTVADHIHFRLSPASDTLRTPGLSSQAADLRTLLVDKGIIR